MQEAEKVEGMRIDLARNKWKSARVSLEGEMYFIRRTFDLGESGEHIYGFDLYSEKSGLVAHYTTVDLADVIECIHLRYFPQPCFSAHFLHV